MSGDNLSWFVVILAAAALAPVLADLLDRWIRIPNVVIEIALGAIVGPAALGWAREDDVISFIADLGLAMLMFLAGLEIDFQRIAGRPLVLASVGWIMSLAIGLGVGALLIPLDGSRSALVVGLAITTTALGTLLPILRDSGELRRPFGTHVLAGAGVGEFGPIIAIALLLSTNRPARTAVFLVAFAVIVAGAVLLATRPRGPRLARLIETTLFTSGQLVVRLVMLLIGLMVSIANDLGLDVLLGAFAAGVVFRLFSGTAEQRESELVEAKLQGLGFGFLVPFFFVVSGIRFDIDALLTDAGAAAKVPLFLVLFLVVRGTPTLLLHRNSMGSSDRYALACYLATELPLVVVITTIGTQTDRLEPSSAAALVGAAMLSVLIYPLLAAKLRARSIAEITDTAPAPRPASSPDPA